MAELERRVEGLTAELAGVRAEAERREEAEEREAVGESGRAGERQPPPEVTLQCIREAGETGSGAGVGYSERLCH